MYSLSPSVNTVTYAVEGESIRNVLSPSQSVRSLGSRKSTRNVLSLSYPKTREPSLVLLPRRKNRLHQLVLVLAGYSQHGVVELPPGQVPDVMLGS